MSPHLTRDIKPQQTGLTFRDRHGGGTTSLLSRLQEACLPGPSPGPLQRKQLEGPGLPVGRLAGWSEVWRPLPQRWLSHWAGAPTGSTQGYPDLWVNLHGCRLQATQGNRGEGSRNL